ncbi:cytochrome b/b6 domain-containing protein [Aestuariispira insulae]|nr:cytochrome b/b6 domain-containing protein [Aestuariispira insulae]
MNNQNGEPGIKVWDPLIRVFHWTLVIMVLFNLMNDEEGQLHQLAGYSVLGLLTFRILWGFVGPHHARFKNFVARPTEVKAYLKGFIYGHDSHYLGHNPAGGWMVLLLLGWLAVTAGTGSMLALPSFAGQGLFEGIHEAFAETLPLIITVHVCGVIVSGLWHRENLVKAMVTGRKPYPRKASS